MYITLVYMYILQYITCVHKQGESHCWILPGVNWFRGWIEDGPSQTPRRGLLNANCTMFHPRSQRSHERKGIRIINTLNVGRKMRSFQNWMVIHSQKRTHRMPKPFKAHKSKRHMKSFEATKMMKNLPACYVLVHIIHTQYMNIHVRTRYQIRGL